ncbi:MAG: cobyrinate a,c-diamide synthase [Lachnospiraceae bacterium]|nr:cobyrinate a,c-diamide synthase [Lachnospiraceae bacterium]
MQNPRIMIAASASGTGKTIFSCALMSLLKKQGKKVRGFKCGPDYIDPMFHRKLAGVDCENLDPFFMEGERMRRILAEAGEGISILEGVMGLYDGIPGGGGSCYEVACATATPILLLMNAMGTGQTVLSSLKGILFDDREHRIAGVVFCYMSRSFFEEIRQEAERVIRDCHSEAVLLGSIQKSNKIHLESRHLGLFLPDEISDLKEQICHFSTLIEEGIDLSRLEEIMEQAETLPTPVLPALKRRKMIRLAVARDEAFSFYYHDNIRLLEECGAEIVRFSPLHDRELPEGISGLLLGGGYPELYARALSDNASMRESIRMAIAGGMPSLAECGGFMYLHEILEDLKGRAYSMVGAIPGRAYYNGHLTRFGYITIEEKGEHPDSFFYKSSMRGHSFHYYESTNAGEDCMAKKPHSDRSWTCMHVGGVHLWGFAHLYYPSDPETIRRFVDKMKDYAADNRKNLQSHSEEPVQNLPASFRFFENKDCEYYPCHKGVRRINCLFCYCPLYWEMDCPGHPRFKEKEGVRIKICTDCTYPHDPDHYEAITGRIRKLFSLQNR